MSKADAIVFGQKTKSNAMLAIVHAIFVVMQAIIFWPAPNANAVAWMQNAIQPGTGFTTKPGVAATRRTPGG